MPLNIFILSGQSTVQNEFIKIKYQIWTLRSRQFRLQLAISELICCSSSFRVISMPRQPGNNGLNGFFESLEGE